jgi:hypothetical protein
MATNAVMWTAAVPDAAGDADTRQHDQGPSAKLEVVPRTLGSLAGACRTRAADFGEDVFAREIEGFVARHVN